MIAEIQTRSMPMGPCGATFFIATDHSSYDAFLDALQAGEPFAADRLSVVLAEHGAGLVWKVFAREAMAIDPEAIRFVSLPPAPAFAFAEGVRPTDFELSPVHAPQKRRQTISAARQADEVRPASEHLTVEKRPGGPAPQRSRSSSRSAVTSSPAAPADQMTLF